MRKLVERFYEELWNRANERVAYEILSENFKFRGSLGIEKQGPDQFLDYLRTIHKALKNYTCIIDDLVVDRDRVAARMTFKGLHRAEFLGKSATDKEISWAGAAFFKMDGQRISELWVLGDIDSIKKQLDIGAPK